MADPDLWPPWGVKINNGINSVCHYTGWHINMWHINLIDHYRQMSQFIYNYSMKTWACSHKKYIFTFTIMHNNNMLPAACCLYMKRNIEASDVLWPLCDCRLPFQQDVEYGNTTSHLGDCDGRLLHYDMDASGCVWWTEGRLRLVAQSLITPTFLLDTEQWEESERIFVTISVI